MTKLISGRIAKVTSANVSADRYQFIGLSETEPDLGLPAVSGYVLSSDINGNRIWVDPASASSVPYFANTSGIANVALTANIANTVLTLSNFTTANLVEGINLYYTNARVISVVTPYLTTANVLESASNLYYTNARVLSALTGNVVVGNLVTGTSVSNSYVTSGNVTAGNVIANGAFFGSGFGGTITGANLLSGAFIQGNSWLGLYTANIIESSSALFYTNTRVNSFVQPYLTTANVTELNNLYYTNARVYSNVIALLPTLAGSGIQIQANGQINANAQVLGLSSLAQFLTTSNVAEGSNLYYTNARVYANVIAALAGNIAIGNATIGNVIVSGSTTFGAGTGGSLTGVNLLSSDNIQTNNLIALSGNILVTGNIIPSEDSRFNFGSADKQWKDFYLSAESLYVGGQKLSGNNQTGLTLVTLTASNITTGNLVVTRSLVGNITGTVSSLSNFTTSNLIEGTNLYFTNARVISALTSYLTTANVLESSSNLYFTNARVTANLEQQSVNVFADVDITGITTNGILIWNGTKFVSGTIDSGTTANVALIAYQADHANTSDSSNVANSVLSLSNFTTANLAESNANLYYTNSRVRSAFTAGQSIIIEANGRISANVSLEFANLNATIANITTNNVAEGNQNLYFTNGRVITAVTSYLTTANVTESNSNLYYTNARVLSALTGNLTIGNLVTGTSVSNSYVTTGNVNAGNVIANTLIIGSASGGSLSGLNLLSVTNIQTNIITASNVNSGNVIANTAFFGSGTGGSVTGANLISATNIQANSWLGLYTSNVIENTNLYFTNARVYSNVIALLPTLAGAGIQIQANGQINATATSLTGNVTIGNLVTGTSVSNSYVTAGNVSAGNVIATTLVLGSATGGSVTGANLISANNITAVNVTAGNVIANTAFFGSGTGGSVTGANLISANNITANNVTAGNVIATGTLLFGSGAGGTILGANLLSANNIQGINWLGLYSANVIENTNLYFTNARVYSNVIALLPTLAGSGIQIQANGQISATASGGAITSTSNVSEGSNLYYTNARVLSALTGNVTIGNLVTGTSVSNSYVTAGNVTAGNIITTGTVLFGTGSGGSIAGANLLSANNIQGINWLGLYTSNVIEGVNQYFTNARVYANIIALLPTLAGSGIQIQANGQINANAQSLSLATLASFLTTSNVSEGSNLYYTNARVLSALTGNLVVGNLVTGTSVSNSYVTAGNITAGNIIANTLVVGSATGGSLTGLNLLSVTNIQTNNITAGNVNSGNVIATGTLFFGSGAGGAIAGANLLSANNIQSNIWLGLYTSNVIEGVNQYFTNARVYSNVIALLPTLAGSGIQIQANGQISATATGGAITSTSNVSEGSNLYYTNSRVLSALTGNITIGNLVTGTSVSNSYVTAGNVTAGNVIGTGTLLFGTGTGGVIAGANLLSANNIQSNIWLGLYSANVIESNSALYYTNARVYSNVTAALAGNVAIGNATIGNVIAAGAVFGSGAGGTIAGANLLSANNIQGINWIGLYTSNVIEGVNQYFTNARVYSNVIALLPTLAGSGIQIQANGQINATAASLTGNVTIGNLVTGTSVSNSYVTTGNVTAGNVIANTLLIGTASGGSLTGLNLLSVTNIQTNIITASNVNSGNVIATTLVLGSATGGSVTGANLLSANNVTAVNVTAGNVIANTAFFGSGAGGSVTGANLISANNIVANTAFFGSGSGGSLTGLNLLSVTNIQTNIITASNINAGNVITTGITVFGSGIGGSVTGANLLSANNIQGINWLGLYTSNVIEGINQYFTNARVYSNVIALLPTLAGAGIQIQANGQINATASATSGFASTSNVANTVLSISNFTTANLAEGANLYYTNARVLSALTGNLVVGNLVTGTSVSNSYVTAGNVNAGNIVATGIAFFGSGVGGSVTGANLISANNIVANTAFFGSGTGGSMTGANLLSATNIQANNWLGLYSANVIENTNLYFTNARVYSNVIALLPTLAGSGIQIQANGQINATASDTSGFASTSNVANTVLTLSNFTTANLAEVSNLYYTNSRVLSALTGNITIGNATIGSVVANTAFFGSGTGGSMTGANLLSANNIQSINWLGLYTANVIESASNLYFTNARVVSALTGNVTIGNLITETSVSNSYVTAGNVNAGNINVPRIVNNGAYNTSIELGSASGVIAVTSDGNATQFLPGGQIRLSPGGVKTILSGYLDGSQIVLGEIQTDLVQNRGGNVTVQVGAEGATTKTWTFGNDGNLYAPGAISAVGNVNAGNVNTTSVQANIWTGIYTANVIETSSNLYFTNARVLAVLSSVPKDFNSRLFYGNSVANTTVISNNFTDSSILVFENGIAQVPGVDYSVNNGLLRFTTPPASNVIVEIRELPTLNAVGTYLSGQNIQVLANGQINSNITVGQNLTISASGQLNATVPDQIHPFLLSLL